MKKIIDKNANLINAKQTIVNTAKKVVPEKIRLNLRKLNWKRMYYQEILLGKTEEEVYCPIAQKKFKTFPNGITITNGARCRHRLFWLYLERETDILTGNYKVLHSAPQYGIWQRLKTYKNIDYVPADKFMDGYDYYEGVENVDLLDIAYNENHFDYVICNRVLEHIEDDITAMKEMFRVLKPGGTALLSVPIDFKLEKTHESYTSREDRIKYYGQWDHVRMYAGDIKERLESVGFEVEMNRYSDNFSEEDMKKYGLCVDTIIVAKKK